MNEFLKQRNYVLPVVFFKKPVALEVDKKKTVYQANSLAILPLHMIEKTAIQKLIDSKHIELYAINEFFRAFNGEKNPTKLFTHIGGGIGDVIAFSAVSEYMKNRAVQVHVEEKFYPIFKWFRSPVDINSYFAPIVTNYTFANRITKFQSLRRLALEYAAIESHGKNWYDGFFKRLGMEQAPEGYRRPYLKRKRISDKGHIISKNSILITHRASCQMRSSSFEDFYHPIRSHFPSTKLYVHEADLTERDKEFVAKKKIKIIPKCSIEQFLLNLYDATLVVSTDSSAIHFREGIEKPCFGVFGAMTVESRTEDYLYSKCFNVISSCPHQPCFIHELKKGDKCLNYTEGETEAKCQSGIGFQEQLYNHIQKYK